MSVIKPLCFKRQYSDKIDIHINSYHTDSHDVLSYYQRNKEQEKIIIPINNSDITISDLKLDDDYFFQTYSSINNENKSLIQSVYFRYVTPLQEFDKLFENIEKKYKEKWQQQIFNKIRGAYNTNPSIPIAQHAWLIMKNTNDLLSREQQIYFDIINTAVKYHNEQNTIMNYDSDYNAKIIETAPIKYITSAIFTSINVKQIISEKKKKITAKIEDSTYGRDTIDIPLVSDSFNEISIYNKDDLVNNYIYYWPNEDYQKIIYLRNIATMNTETLEDALSTSLELSVCSEKFTKTEEEMLKKENKLKPYNKIIARPEVYEDSTWITTIKIPNFNKLKAAGKTYYLCSKEDDMLFEAYSGVIEIIDKATMKVSKVQHCLGGNTLFWIEDDNNNIISPLTRHSYDQDLSEYNEKVRVYNYETYLKRLVNTVKMIVPEQEIYISNLVSRLMHDAESNQDSIKDELIDEILRYGINLSDTDKLVQTVLEDDLKNRKYSASFFKENVKYDYSANKVILPSTKDTDRYLLEFKHNTIGNKNMTIEYILSSNNPITIDFTKYDHCILQATDIQTNIVSGYIIINNNDNLNPKMIKSNIGIDRI